MNWTFVVSVIMSANIAGWVAWTAFPTETATFIQISIMVLGVGLFSRMIYHMMNVSHFGSN